MVRWLGTSEMYSFDTHSTGYILKVSPDLRPVQDSSPYNERQDHVTPTRSWRNVPIVKALLIRLLTAPLLSKEQDQWCRKNE